MSGDASRVKVIAFRDSGWLPQRTDFRQWDHLCRAYGVELQMISDWNEAVVPEGSITVGVEESAEISLRDFIHPVEATYIFGRSGHNVLNEVNFDISVCIPTLNSISLFGVVACGIILQNRFN